MSILRGKFVRTAAGAVAGGALSVMLVFPLTVSDQEREALDRVYNEMELAERMGADPNTVLYDGNGDLTPDAQIASGATNKFLLTTLLLAGVGGFVGRRTAKNQDNDSSPNPPGGPS